MNSVETLFHKVPPKLSSPVFLSQLRLSPTHPVLEAAVYPEGLQVGDSFMDFIFGVRFNLEDQELSIFHEDDVIVWRLVLDDEVSWRLSLRMHLNQKGFHDKFKAIKRIGRGNFASVFLVQKHEDKRKYAVKSFTKEAAYSEQNGKECLVKEIEIMRKLSSRNNVKLFEVYESDNSLYIVLELLEGGQLHERIKSKEKFTPQQIQTMVKGILEGLREMHSRNIMHRDLKPENILFRSDQSYDCVIADYGLAELADASKYLFVCCGTPGYVAPEIINIRDKTSKYNPVCDIFSLGLIFHLLVFGRSPFKGKTYEEVLNQNRACSFSLDSPEHALVDPNIMSLMKGMLTIDPAKRISAEQALKHPYFRATEEAEVEELRESMEIAMLPFQQVSVNTAAEKGKKESVIELKQARDQGIFTGHTKTVGSMTRDKTSILGAKPGKVSRYVRGSGNKQN